MWKSRNFVAVTSVVLFWVCNAGGQSLTVEEKCAKSKVNATTALLRCLVREKVKSVQRDCEGKHSSRFEKAEDRATSKGGQCSTVEDASEIQKTTATFVDVLLGTTDVFLCTPGADGRVDCLVNVAADVTSFDLSTDLLSAAQELDSSISEDTTLWIQAWGGGGGNGTTSSGSSTGKGGKGGYAQTVTTIRDVGDGTVNPLITTTVVSVVVGGNGCHKSSYADGGGGGFGTAVYVLQTSSGGTNFQTIVSAGGAGGGTYAQSVFQGGYGGGDGAVAIATDTDEASIKGKNGGGSRTGQAGNSDGNGNGGSASSSSDAVAGSSGSKGKVGSGAKSAYGCEGDFVLVNKNDESEFTGKGGVANTTSSHLVSGGSGGGGVGGGGGGGSVEVGRDPGGGGGAGSFASQNTRSDPKAPSSADDVDLSRSQGQILFTFNPN